MNKNRSTFEVLAERCDQCLFTPQRIVSVQRMQQVLQDCDDNDQYFTCHKAQLADRDICCRGFYDRDPHATAAMRLAAMLNVVRFVPEGDL